MRHRNSRPMALRARKHRTGSRIAADGDDADAQMLPLPIIETGQLKRRTARPSCEALGDDAGPAFMQGHHGVRGANAAHGSIPPSLGHEAHSATLRAEL